ncbi:MAG: IS3 family transposase [Bacteroidetes bacterium]|nr:IS3 family transposase [Bacteroidota bacterium]
MYPTFSVGYYCLLFGRSRQAYYEYKSDTEKETIRDLLILKLVSEIRKDLPRSGVPQLRQLLKIPFEEHGIQMGRDSLYTLLGEHGYLLRYRRRKAYTTNSNHAYKKYPNLIRNMKVEKAHTLWVSDITYIRLASSFAYLSIVTDAYSRKIVGYHLQNSLHATGPIKALDMALAQRKITDKLIHHSDRGVQYCCGDYVAVLKEAVVEISMTEKGDPYENAIAERVNGILKMELLLDSTFDAFDDAKQAVEWAVEKYNFIRPHSSCDYLTPELAHEREGILKKHWKNYPYKPKQIAEPMTALPQVL